MIYLNNYVGSPPILDHNMKFLDVASRSTPFYHEKQRGKVKRQYLADKREEKYQTGGYDDYAPQTPSAPPYFQHVHDEFMQQLHDHVRDEWGIEIQNICIDCLC